MHNAPMLFASDIWQGLACKHEGMDRSIKLDGDCFNKNLWIYWTHIYIGLCTWIQYIENQEIKEQTKVIHENCQQRDSLWKSGNGYL